MGIRKAIKSGMDTMRSVVDFAGGMLETMVVDQFAEYFRCEGLSNQTFMTPATLVQRNVGSKGNMRANASAARTENLITSGSVFDVAVNQCAILIENGKVHDCIVANTPELAGQYVYVSDAEPSFFMGDAGAPNAGFSAPEKQGIGAVLKEAVNQYKHRAQFGGQSTNTMYLFYINMRPMLQIPVGAGDIRVRDNNVRMTVTMGVSGTFTCQITNPVQFYENYIYNPTEPMTLTSPDGKQFINTVRGLIANGLKNVVHNVTTEQNLTNWWDFDGNPEAINRAVSTVIGPEIAKTFGLTISTVALTPKISESDLAKLNEYDDKMRVATNKELMVYEMMNRSFDVQQTAAGNSGGAMVGFMGANMAQMAGQNMQGGMMNYINNMPNQPAQSTQPAQQPAMTPAQNAGQFRGTTPAPVAGSGSGEQWTCECGTVNTTKFCMDCGKPKPAPAPVAPANAAWTCECGSVNTSKFCKDCGKPKPAARKVYKCDKCGWTPADPTKPPRFCPECGDVFDANDAV